ncbi:MAG: hypothetical protein JO002_12600, partial [Burkholderiaceae bacterium]|nr:hypothetical protein [Burkholderiaceae bacterium]
ELATMQARGVMPQPAYRLALDIACDSFFGRHQSQTDVAYYAKGYAAWINIVRNMQAEDAFELFAQRYKAQLRQLAEAGMSAAHDKLNAGLDVHLGGEWQYFLDGTYGLCTRSGLPEDIAIKELATTVIKEITEERYDKPLSHAEHAKLAAAVGLLDAASAPFAPHERLRSSRYRLVDQMRTAYGV